MDILSKRTKKLIVTQEFKEAIDRLISDENLREVEITLPSGDRVKIRKLLL